MNERIKELELEAAYDTIDPNGPFTAEEFNQFTKKFAELIVKECSGIVQNYMGRWPEDCDLVIKIKEHFGVEE